MPRSIWTGAISFGLVSVPVKLYSAVSPKSVRFHQLHASDGVRIQQKRVCPADGEEVAYEDLVKGYEVAPDRYVVIEPEELASLEPTRTRTIEIEDFVQLDEIDPIYYDHPYYLAPGPGGAKPYRLLLDAMRDTGKVAIARVVLRSKEQLVAIRPMGDLLGMATMNFADEVVPTDRLDDLPGEEVKTTDRELGIARQLVESLATEFDPDKYHDTYREAVLSLIERKAQGEEIAVQPAAEETTTEAPDLMSALQASLAEVRQRTGDGGDSQSSAPRKRSRSGSDNGGGAASGSAAKGAKSGKAAKTSKSGKAPAKRTSTSRKSGSGSGARGRSS
jgi:DNA end-binding protein Ku